MELPRSFDEFIRKKRQNLDLSKEMFPELLGLGKRGENTVNNWELKKTDLQLLSIKQ